MKKIILIIFITLVNIQVFSQKNDICGSIDYTCTTNLAYKYQEKYNLKFNSKFSLSEEVDIKYSKNKEDKNNSSKGETRISIAGRKNLTPKIFYNTKKDFYFSDVWDDSELIVKETPFKWNWDIKEKFKQIGRFRCQMATIKFRGRNYIAWFTNKIPTSFGPWKFQGLPGLILEVYDNDRVFYITADKIHIENKQFCENKFVENKLTNALDISSYLKEIDLLIDKEFAKLSAKLPKGAKPLKRSKNCEDCSQGIEIFSNE
tara:strand:- start:29313 stop:30092 length:780 start_codon:yes stop_codon:yes gene_type:complete